MKSTHTQITIRRGMASVLVAIMALSVSTTALFIPSAVYADSQPKVIPFVTPPTGFPVGEPGVAATDAVDIIGGALVTAARVGLKSALKAFLEKLAYDAAVWIASGGESQKPLVFTEELGNYISSAGDAAIGDFLNGLASENGYAKLDLCNLPELEKVKIQSFVPQLLGAEEPAGVGAAPSAKCSLTDIVNSFKDYGTNYALQAAVIMDDTEGLVNFSKSFDQGANYMSTMLKAVDEAAEAQSEEEATAKLEREKGDFKDQEAKISGYIQTPSAVVQKQFESSIDKSTEGETTQQGNIIADALTVFVNTLTSKLMDRLSSGLLSFFTEPDIGDSLGGNSGRGGGSQAGVRGAQERFASFKTPSFSTGGQIEILQRFATCAGPNAMDVTNCVINENLRLAIEEQLSLREALDQGVIDGEWKFGTEMDEENPQQSLVNGIPIRNIKILKQYSVVPVGWVLAAEYNREFDTVKSIQQVVDGFDKCGVDNYSPYCGLVDPDWVLKAPEVFCKVEAFGEVVATPDLFIDLDGNEFTPETNLISRLNSCVDFQTCLSDDNNGTCEGGQYGYCTKQKDIYRFQGDSCPAQDASCEIFTKEGGDGVGSGYLQNTLNYNDCSVDNVGCQWNCSVYNVIDEEFQCAEQSAIWTTCTDVAGCQCTSGSEQCTISEGGFKCDTATQGTCHLGTQNDTTTGLDATITFDNDVQTCSDSDNGCTEFTSVKGGANLLFNASFEDFDTYQDITPDALLALSSITSADPYDDSFGFYGVNGDGSDPATPGQPCETEAGGNPCYGWQVDGVGARAVDDAIYGSVAIQLPADAALNFIRSEFDTGQPLANRTFALTYAAQNADASDCIGEYYIAEESNATPDTVEVDYPSAIGFDFITSDVITFGPNVTDTTIAVGISQGDTCNIILDGAQLEENVGSSAFSEYNDDAYDLNVNKTNSCTVAEIGCELYEPQTGESELNIPGIVTNPLSEACGDGDDFTNPACSQCMQEFVGCDAFIVTETPYNAPVNDGSAIPGFYTAAFNATTASAIAQRGGFYCENTFTPCSLGREAFECGGAACLPSVSIIPDTGDSCSAGNVGCEQYVNLEEVSQGGEGIQYFQYIKQCVKPTVAQETNNEVGTYFTFEGSDQSGYQIRSWLLKKSEDVDAAGNGAPCTNLDLYGPTAETPEAACIDVAATPQTCSALDVGVDPDCTEYFDAGGNVYYRLRSATITVSDSCVGLRNSLDNRVYYSIPVESTSCSATANLCREFRGSEGGNVDVILEDDFDSGVWFGGEASGTVVTANSGQSMAIGTGTTTGSTEAKYTIGNLIDVNESYVVTFWAKASTTGTTLDAYFFSPDTGIYNNFDTTGVELTEEWNRYTMGPFIFDSTLIGDEQFGFAYNGLIGPPSTAYIDNMELTRNTNRYLIAGTAEPCNGYEGCEEYTDSSNATSYLKSFTGLCSEEAVGCEAVINTHNSDTPYYKVYNASNEFSGDNVPVATDVVETYAVVPSALCLSEVAGCGFYGIPSLDEGGFPTAYTGRYTINDPDQYDTILCEEQQRSCEAYTASTGSTAYFKDPGEKTCEYNTGSGQWEKEDGSVCPVQNANALPSQPKGPVCNGGVRWGQLCSTDEDCPSVDSNIYRCSSNINTDSGWVGMCEEEKAGCTEYVDPNTDSLIYNGDFETNIQDNDNTSSITPDSIPDYWEDYGNTLTVNIPVGYSTAAGKNAITCGIFEENSDYIYSGRKSLKISRGSTSTSDICIVGPAGSIPVDVNKTYTLSGDLYINDPTPESVGQRAALGLHYYDIDGNEILTKTIFGAPLQTEDYAIAAWEGAERGAIPAALVNQWNRYQASIGPGLGITFPEGTYTVKVFVEAGTDGGGTYFDNIRFSQVESYTYINNTVDGTPEGDENSCNGSIDVKKGCVAFREVGNDDLMTDLSSIAEHEPAAGGAVQTCEFDSISDSCNSTANTADTNRVLKVQNDRECAEWLGCRRGVVSDQDGDGIYETSTCTKVGNCTKRNPNTGKCTTFKPERFSPLGYDDDQTVISEPGNPIDLLVIKGLSGYTSVGGSWIGVCSAGSCLGGANVGNSCISDTDCVNAQVTFGHYPYDWAPERGGGGAMTTGEIVQHSDFEDVKCNGNSSFSTTNLDPFTTVQSPLESQRDRTLSCTVDRHCRTAATEASLNVMADNATNAYGINFENTDDIAYEEGWCAGVGSNTPGEWYEWAATGSSSLSIIDHDDDRDYSTPYQAVDPAAPAAPQLDLNNVLYVEPSGESQSGVEVDLADAIIQDREYTLSFDGQYMQTPDVQRDFMRIGLQHGTNPDNTDYFEGGSAKADLIFIIDASASMDAEIANVASGLSALTAGLSSSGIDYQAAIVITGHSEGPHVLDYTDYTGYFGTNFGSNNDNGRDFSDDTTELVSVLSNIAVAVASSGNLYGSEHNYEAVREISVNEFSADSNYALNLRSDASPFVILLTDEAPDGDPNITGPWDETDEENFIANILPVNTPVLYTIAQTAGVPYEAYDQLTAHLGGEMYDISLSSYTDMLDEISVDIVRQSLDFRFESKWERYSLGPITITNKVDPEDETVLFFEQVDGSTDTPFAIDNVSLKPALEVSKENNPNSSLSSQLISRDCRAYPESDSESCNYSDNTGTFYTGWKGYCLERDDLNSDRCVAWWPVDVISGEPGVFPQAVPVNYEGPYPAYYCLVAKGNQNLGACMGVELNSGSEAQCSSDGECTGGERCLGNSFVTGGNAYFVPQQRALTRCSFCGCNSTCGAQIDTESDYSTNFFDFGSSSLQHTITSGPGPGFPGSYRVKHAITTLRIDPTGAAHKNTIIGQSDDDEWAVFVKHEPSPVEKSIHISEIDNISFNMGVPDYGGSGVPFYSPPGNSQVAHVDLAWLAGSVGFNTRNLETGSTKLWKANSGRETDTWDAITEPGLADSNIPAWAYQYGAWCNPDSGESGLCAAGGAITADPEQIADMDFIYVKGVAPAPGELDLWWKNGIDHTILNEQTATSGTPQPFNPFNEFAALAPESPIWNTLGFLPGNFSPTGSSYYVDNGSGGAIALDLNPSVPGGGLLPTYFPTKSNAIGDCFINISSMCGANVLVVKFDFEDGYLDGVYTGYVDGMRRFDVQSIDNIWWQFDLREPCLLAVEGAVANSQGVDAKPWQTRVSPNSTYSVLGLGYTYLTEGAITSLGSGFAPIGNDGSWPPSNPAALDGLAQTGTANVTAAASNNLPFAYINNGVGIGAPYSCIGDCDVVCEDDYSNTSYLASPGCASNLWVGGAGVCEYNEGPIALNVNGNAIACNSASGGCPSGTFCDASFLDGAGLDPSVMDVTSFTSYEQQLQAAARTGWVRFRQLFVDVGNVWYAADDGSNRHAGFLSEGSLNESDFLDANGNGIYDFTEMEECPSIDRNDDEYCYHKPTVTNIRIDGNESGTVELYSGESVNLSFDSYVDPDQQPLETISIDWNGSTADEDFPITADALPWNGQSQAEHQFFNVYTCDTSNPLVWDSSEGVCRYKLKIQIQDKWGSCNGVISGDGINDYTRDSGTGSCTSYDEYPSEIRVLPSAG